MGQRQETNMVRANPSKTTPSPQPNGDLRDRRSPRGRGRKLATAAAIAMSLSLATAACGSDSSDGDAKTSSSGSADVDAAKAAIADYTGKPSAFPVDVPLSKPLPAGTTIAYLGPNTPTTAAGAESAKAAAEVLGADLEVVNAGQTATTAQAAAATVLAMEPDAVIVGGFPPSFFGKSLQELSDAGIKVISNATAEDTEPYGVDFNYRGADAFELVGSLMADWVIANNGGGQQTAFYGLPALDFSKAVQKGYQDELKKNCPSCSVRNVDIDIATLGTTASQKVVSDLQANPDTDVAVFMIADIATGLPAALKAAGISGISTIGYGTSPQTLQYIKDGEMTAGLALDVPTTNWTMMDIAARMIVGDELTQLEVDGAAPTQFVTKDDLADADVSKGYVAYPDYVSSFTELWKPAS